MSTSYFTHSRNVRIQNASFHNHEAGPSRSSRPWDDLCDNIAPEAIHNSDERCDAPKCHPETRVAVQEEIFSWIRHGGNDDEPKKILWVTGPAGTGKTAIAGSIAEMCEEEGLLAGSFFFSSFSGSEKRKSKRFLVATLAYCFLQHDALQPLREYILSAIERDPAVFTKRLRDQCKTLLLKPFYDTIGCLDLSSLPIVIVIDGLDEVVSAKSHLLEKHDARSANEADQVEVLSALLQAAHDPNFPFRIVVVSRPEPAIRDFFTNNANHISRELFLDDKYDPDSDITLFLNAKLADIRRRYGLPHSWPLQGDVEALVERASGQFVYAATVVRFLQDKKLPDPRGRLQTVLSLRFQATGLNPLAQLDALYTQILMSSPEPLLAVQWIHVIWGFRGKPAWFLRQLLQEFEGQAVYLLENLASLIKLPQDIDVYGTSSYEFYHKSLFDFLDSGRCGHELADAGEMRDALLDERVKHVLITKTSHTLLPEAHLREFSRHFFQHMNDGFSADSPHLEGLATCDVVWWAHTITALSETENLEYRLKTLYGKVHGLCKSWESEGFHTCHAVCKHWRANLHRACSALGREPPGAVDLLQEKLTSLYFGGDPPYLTRGFERPKEERACSSIENLPPTIYGSRIEEYERVCDTAAGMFSCLPSDWRDLCGPDLSYGSGPDTVLRALSSHIPDVFLELGIEIENTDNGGDDFDSDDFDSNCDCECHNDDGTGGDYNCECRGDNVIETEREGGGSSSGDRDTSLNNARDERDDEGRYDSESVDEGEYEFDAPSGGGGAVTPP